MAHHGDDCAETVLFHLSRGTGLRGLCGIVPVRELPEQKLTLIRPLLCVTKAEIEAYLEQIGQEYRTDSTNADVAMSRNRIRSQVLPQLCEVNTAVVPHIVRTAGYLEEICEYLDEAAWEAGKAYVTYERVRDACGNLEDFNRQSVYGQEKDADKAGTENGITKIHLQRQGILSVPVVLQKNLIHRLLGELAGSKKDLTAAHMEAVQMLFTAQVGKTVCLPYGIRAYADYEQIIDTDGTIYQPLEDKTVSVEFKVTDQAVTKQANGIVQGMSGSPIIQNDKIIGCVTHVSGNNPMLGYGLYIEWMLEMDK